MSSKEKLNNPQRSYFVSILQGMQLASPIVLGYLPLGFAFGVLAVQNGIPFFFTILMSISIFAGSGQFIAASMVGMGAPIFSILIANILVNLRYFLMVSSLLKYIRPLSFFKKILFSAEITDEIFAVHYSSSQKQEGEHTPYDTARIFAINITGHLGWIFGTLLGALSGERMTDIKPFGLDYALPAMFIALLVPLCFVRLHFIVAILSTFLFLLAIFLDAGKYSLILASIIAASFGAYVEMKKEKQEKSLGL